MFSVLGAGVAGLCAATALAERGCRVEVIDPDPAPTGASWYAGGMLAPFCEGEAAPDGIVTRGQAARDWWAARVPGVLQQGTLVVAPPRDRVELDRFACATRGHDRVVPGEIEPDLGGRFAVGLHFAQEAHLDPRAACSALIARLRGMGVELHFGAQRRPRGQIVDCRGWAARADLPGLRAVRGEMLMIETREVALSRPVRLLHPRFPCYVVPRGDGRFMVGATMIESEDDGPITARTVMELLSAAYTVHPAFGEARLIETGAGLRPAFADNVPAVVARGDRIHVNGLYRHGFLMGPALAEELAAMVFQEQRHAG
ncbi:FAD-dependent oxidoreductase [Pukyongiella litopenaei]|uniref:FAD-dependent oxidoreductase n=1 Tax=Pukyongiella litopenaei TaxID=2605946 RepID=A0A2S0MV98_9RHOB|nr:FAD-dependent oxidoreductase [Pukyongiella litopenaei]AVO39816.1 FAD-dependent oxidoreductase [Pukyongiella litopenaei]